MLSLLEKQAEKALIYLARDKMWRFWGHILSKVSISLISSNAKANIYFRLRKGHKLIKFLAMTVGFKLKIDSKFFIYVCDMF